MNCIYIFKTILVKSLDHVLKEQAKRSSKAYTIYIKIFYKMN